MVVPPRRSFGRGYGIGGSFIGRSRALRGGPNSDGGVDRREVWRRFPKFVLGFFITSAIVTAVTASYSLEEYNRVAVAGLVGPIKDLRTWTFIFCFFSIGLMTRFRDLATVGRRPFGAFTVDVAVNVALGFVLSVYVFGVGADSQTLLGSERI